MHQLFNDLVQFEMTTTSDLRMRLKGNIEFFRDGHCELNLKELHKIVFNCDIDRMDIEKCKRRVVLMIRFLKQISAIHGFLYFFDLSGLLYEINQFLNLFNGSHPLLISGDNKEIQERSYNRVLYMGMNATFMHLICTFVGELFCRLCRFFNRFIFNLPIDYLTYVVLKRKEYAEAGYAKKVVDFLADPPTMTEQDVFLMIMDFSNHHMRFYNPEIDPGIILPKEKRLLHQKPISLIVHSQMLSPLELEILSLLTDGFAFYAGYLYDCIVYTANGPVLFFEVIGKLLNFEIDPQFPRTYTVSFDHEKQELFMCSKLSSSIETPEISINNLQLRINFIYQNTDDGTLSAIPILLTSLISFKPLFTVKNHRSDGNSSFIIEESAFQNNEGYFPGPSPDRKLVGFALSHDDKRPSWSHSSDSIMLLTNHSCSPNRLYLFYPRERITFRGNIHENVFGESDHCVSDFALGPAANVGSVNGLHLDTRYNFGFSGDLINTESDSPAQLCVSLQVTTGPKGLLKIHMHEIQLVVDKMYFKMGN